MRPSGACMGANAPNYKTHASLAVLLSRAPWFGVVDFCVTHGDFMDRPLTGVNDEHGNPVDDYWCVASVCRGSLLPMHLPCMCLTSGCRWQDQLLGRLFRALASAGVANSTAVIVTSDHAGLGVPAEGITLIDWRKCKRNQCSAACPCARHHDTAPYVEQGRHARITSGHVNVPLLVRVPRRHRAVKSLRRNQHAVVSTTDILPTVVDLVLWRGQSRVRRSSVARHGCIGSHLLLPAVPAPGHKGKPAPVRVTRQWVIVAASNPAAPHACGAQHGHVPRLVAGAVRRAPQRLHASVRRRQQHVCFGALWQ